MITDELCKEIAGERELVYNLMYVIGGKYVNNKNPLSFHTVLNSESGAGKDFILSKIIKIFEVNEDYESYTRISPRALNYLHANNIEFTWDGKFLILHDVDEEILNSSTMKVFLTEGSHTAIVDKGAVWIKNVKGRPIVLMTTAYSDPNIEQLRRVNILNLDESEEQTKRIILFQSMQSQNEREYETTIDYDKIKKEVSKLQSWSVRIPFAEKLVNKIDCNNIHLRTFFPKILDFIKSSAVLNQDQREKAKGYLTAEVEDYENIRHIINSFAHGTTFKPLSIARKEMLDLIKQSFEYSWFSVSDLSSYSGKSYESTRKLLKGLIDEDYLEMKREQAEYNSKFYTSYKLKEYNKVSLPTLLEG